MMYVHFFPMFLLLPPVAHSLGQVLQKDKLKFQDSGDIYDEEYGDYQNDGPRFPSDGSIHVDPKFPVYSNWERTDERISINSPRKEDALEAGGPPPGGQEVGKDGKYINIKLPDDILKHFEKQYGIGNDDHISNILGIPADHLPNLGTGKDDHLQNLGAGKNDRNQQTTTKRQQTTTMKRLTTEAVPTKQDMYNQDYDDHWKSEESESNNEKEKERSEDEYYNRQDLLPKLTEAGTANQQNSNRERAGSENSDTPTTSTSSRSVWSVLWQAHVYLTGTMFVLLALYCIVNICRLHMFSRLFSRGYFLSLNACMIAVGVSRGLFLLVDAYNEGGTFYSPLAYMLLNIGYPCITSAFAILFLALLRVTQVELLSPSVQTPRGLGIFCSLHIFISLCLDITVGLVTKLQYLLLLGQGIFIVWSLLLSAGYFYIYSTMRKVVCPQNSEMHRSMYPKLMYEQHAGGAVQGGPGSDTYSMRLPATGSYRPPISPLARAVNLTLGVAVLGSLMGGVQLYGMIGMHGLLRSNPREIPDPWYGYQVSLRVLELCICYLLAVVATTPLRTDMDALVGGPCSSCSPLLCCQGEGVDCGKCGGEPQPAHLDEEIYTEIVVNHHTSRFNGVEGYSLANMDAYNPNLGNLVDQSQNPHCTATLALTSSAASAQQQHQQLQQQQMMLQQQQQQQQQQMNNTLARRRQQGQAPRTSGISGDSNATMDTALYSNLRSRPSSMLFNDSGFVRFRLGNDPSVNQQDLMRQSCQDLVNGPMDEAGGEGEGAGASGGGNGGNRESIRGSRSFDDGVISEIKRNFPDAKGLERPQSNLSYTGSRGQAEGRQIKSELCSPDVEGLPGLPQRPASKLKMFQNMNSMNGPGSPTFNNRLESDTDNNEHEQYEAPAGLILPEATKSLAAQVRSVVGYSESDLSSLDPVYAAGKSIYGVGGGIYGANGGNYSSRAPSRCSSISATQSFDMRVYGRIGASGAATLGRPLPKPKLDNKFYYYGSTRNQKKSSQKEALTPRPLLPSQRALQGAETNTSRPSPVPPKNGPGPALNPSPSQLLYDQIMNSQGRPPPMGSAALQRSRSLGRDSTPTHLPGVPGGAHLPPRAPPGSRTPTSVARKVLESVTKRKNKDKNRGGRPPLDPGIAARKGLLGPGPGQLVQTPDGRLVALGPGNTFYDVGALQQQQQQHQAMAMMDQRLAHFVDPRTGAILTASVNGQPVLDPRLARQISQDREEMLYGDGRPDLDPRLTYNARLQGLVSTPPTGRVQGGPLRSRYGAYGGGGGDEPGDGIYSDQFNQLAYADTSPQELDRITGHQQAARLAGNLSSPPWRGARLPLDGKPPPADDDDSDVQSSTDTNQQLMQYSEPPGGLLGLGKDITPDSGVVTESRNHSKERENQEARLRRENFASNNNHHNRSSRNCAEQLEQLGEQLSRSSCGDQLSQLGVQLDQLGEQLGQLQKEQEKAGKQGPASTTQQLMKKQHQHQDGSCSSSDESSCEGDPSHGKGVRKNQYKSIPQTDPSNNQKKTNNANDSKDKRERKSSVQSNISDSDPVSYEFSADSLLSDSDKDSPPGNSTEPPVSEKLTNVCNEIKARFLPE